MELSYSTYDRFKIKPSINDTTLQDNEMKNDFFSDNLNMPRIIIVSIKIAASSDTNIYQSFDFRNKGKMNHKYGNVAMEAKMPVRNIYFRGIVFFRSRDFERINRTIVSIETVSSNECKKFIS